MRMIRHAALLFTVLAITSSARADENEGLTFTPLFNGKDLTGWVPVNVAPKTFTVKDGVIHSTGTPTGIMRTERQYENCVVELDWMHEKPAGNAGLFLWGAAMTAPGTPFSKGIEIQILDDAFVTGQARAENWYTGHGDIFSIHGASMKPDRPHPKGWERCLPSENRTKPAGEWNHYRVEARDGRVTLAVNGKVVSGGSMCRPRKGYLCLESEGSPAQFKNIRVAELPSTNPKPEECQPLAEDFHSLYTGVDLSNWVQEPGHKGHWKPGDWVLNYDGKSEASDKTLWSEKAFGDFELVVDWHVPAQTPPLAPGAVAGHVNILSRKLTVPLLIPADGSPADRWNRSMITLKGDALTVTVNDKLQKTTDTPAGPSPVRAPVGLSSNDGQPMDFANVFIRELK